MRLFVKATVCNRFCANERNIVSSFSGSLPLFINASPSMIEQVLIFHLSNHYALIFALREWHCPAATTASPTRSTSPTTSSTLLPTTTTTAATTTTMAEVSDTRDGASTTRNDGFTLEGARDRNVISCDSRVGWTRQLLTAKRGQRPSTWIDFDDARRTMLGWQGYKIIAVQRGKAASTPL